VLVASRQDGFDCFFFFFFFFLFVSIARGKKKKKKPWLAAIIIWERVYNKSSMPISYFHDAGLKSN